MLSPIPRHAQPIATEYLGYFPGLVIEGARQVGKSTLARQAAAESALIFTLDDEQTLAAAQADPAGFVGQARGRQMVIDEIQRFPALTLAVKASIDMDRRPGRFILTGSSSLLHVRGLADSLAGRVGRLPLYGLSRGEVSGVRDDLVARLVGEVSLLAQASSTLDRQAYADFLAVGAYPELLGAPERARGLWIDGYLQGVVGRDMSELRREVRPARAMAVLRTLAGRQSAELVKAKLAEQTSVPASTITGYLDLLHDVGLVASIPPWTPNLAKREVGRPKSLILDSAIAMRLARLTSGQLSRLEYGEAFGGLLEAFVAAEFLRQRTWSTCEYDLFHYRDRDGDEVDLVLELSDGRVVAIEVKASTSFSAAHFKGLARMRERLGDRFVAGVVLNTGTSGYRYADRLYGAPISAMWEVPSS